MSECAHVLYVCKFTLLDKKTKFTRFESTSEPGVRSKERMGRSRETIIPGRDEQTSGSHGDGSGTVEDDYHRLSKPREGTLRIEDRRRDLPG